MEIPKRYIINQSDDDFEDKKEDEDADDGEDDLDDDDLDDGGTDEE